MKKASVFSNLKKPYLAKRIGHQNDHNLERRLKFIWDFRGPFASKTAEHHEIHLKEYIATQKLSLSITGCENITEMHSLAYMIVTDSEMKMVRDALKPHRGQLYQQ